MNKSILNYIIILLLIFVSVSGCISDENEKEDKDRDDKDNIESKDNIRNFIFTGIVNDSDTRRPLEDVQVRLEVTWGYGYKTREPPPPTFTDILGETNTLSNGSYYLKAPTYENESADYIEYTLIFIKPRYFHYNSEIIDTGEKVMEHSFNVSLFVWVELDGNITNEIGLPLDKAIIIVNVADQYEVKKPEIYHLTIAYNGKYSFNYLSSKYNYDIIIGCDGYQTKLIENVFLNGHINHIINESLISINYSARNITMNGTLTFDWGFSDDLFKNEMFFIWVYNDQDQVIEILNVNELGNFTINLSIGSFYFTPFSCPQNLDIDWSLGNQPIEISKDTEIEIIGNIYPI